MNRRVFLASSSVLLAGYAGGRFVGTEASPRPGTLRLVNDDQNSHTVTVAVEKMSRRETEVPTYSWRATHEAPTEEPLWRKGETFEHAAEQAVERAEFISEGGSYHLEAMVADSGRVGIWVRFREAADGDGLWGRVPRVRIFGHDAFSFPAEDTGRVKPPESQTSVGSSQS